MLCQGETTTVNTVDLSAKRLSSFVLQPLTIFKGYRRGNVRPDLMAGLTVAVVAVPQTIAYASIAGLPPSYGLYTACVASIAGSLWGSSRFLSTGPTNALSILVLSILAPLAVIGSPEYLAAAGIMASMQPAFIPAFIGQALGRPTGSKVARAQRGASPGEGPGESAGEAG